MARTIGDQAIESRAMSILGVDLATLGDIGGGIELLRGSVALANPADDPTIVPRAYANLGTVLEMGGFVEEALEVSLAGADQIARFGSELGFLTFLEVNAAAMLIELARYPEAAELLERNVPRVLPGLGTIHLYTTLAHLAIRMGDLPAARRYLDTAEREAGGIADAQYVIDLQRVRDGDRPLGRRSGGGPRDRAGRLRPAGRDGRRGHPRPARHPGRASCRGHRGGSPGRDATRPAQRRRSTAPATSSNATARRPSD